MIFNIKNNKQLHNTMTYKQVNTSQSMSLHHNHTNISTENDILISTLSVRNTFNGAKPLFVVIKKRNTLASGEKRVAYSHVQ